jgi:hypothetical protein
MASEEGGQRLRQGQHNGDNAQSRVDLGPIPLQHQGIVTKLNFLSYRLANPDAGPFATLNAQNAD